VKRASLVVAVLFLLASPWCGSRPVDARPSKGARAPETSSDESFRAQDLAKLAVIVSTEGRRQDSRGNPRQTQTQSDPQRLVEDVFVQTLLEKGHVVVARSDIKAVLKEQELASSGLTDDNAAAMGKLLNVPAVMVVTITEYTSENQRDGKKNAQVIMARASLGARLVSVETGGICWQGRHSLSEAIEGRSELLLLLDKVTEKLARAFPVKEPAKTGKKKSSFDPKGIEKLALIMVGDSRSRNLRIDRKMDPSDQQRLVEDKLGILLGNKGYALVSRSDLQSVMQEKQFQESGLTEENVSDLGKLLNIPAVMVVRITEFGAESQRKLGGKSKPNSNVTVAIAALGARLVSVETGEILWCRTSIESEEVAGKLDATEVLTKVAAKIGNAFPNRAGFSKKTSSK